MKLYTGNTCTKCMALKSTLKMLDKMDGIEEINIDDNLEVREWILSEESGNPYRALPIFEHEGNFYNETPQIMTIIMGDE